MNPNRQNQLNLPLVATLLPLIDYYASIGNTDAIAQIRKVIEDAILSGAVVDYQSSTQNLLEYCNLLYYEFKTNKPPQERTSSQSIRNQLIHDLQRPRQI